MSTPQFRKRWVALLPVTALLAGTLVWGTIWYPYRALAASGLGALTSSMLTYAVALVLAAAVFGRSAWVRLDLQLFALALSAGVTNVGFIWATNSGIVLRVLLLFYLMPVWTVCWVFLLLGIAPGFRTLVFTSVALAGAAVMLWQPGIAFPLPSSKAEWAAVVAGMAFALSNVLIHRMTDYSAQNKSLWILVGCTVLGAFGATGEGAWRGPILPENLALIAIIGVVLCAINLVVQHGVERVSPERVPLIYLFELVVAAGSAWALVGEPVRLKEVAGGVLILAASMMPARLATARQLGGLVGPHPMPPDRLLAVAETMPHDVPR